MEKRMVLGSGKLYFQEFSGTIPEDATIETEDNILGLIKGGATLTYTPEFYEASDDLGIVVRKMPTKETVVLKSGLMTWSAKTLNKLCNTARVSEDTGKKTRTVKIGGIGNYDGKKYVLRFVHEDPENGKIRITIVGANEAGFEIAFAKDAETVIDAQFSAFPMDNEGTLIIYQEEDSTLAAAAAKL